jgi:predicted DsbA family dithiol-disulfide isomerase
LSAAGEPLRVRVHYDFASTLCYVAHRALARLEGRISALGIELAWTPLDLARLAGPWRAGAEIDALRRGNAARVAEELAVAVRVPRVWPDGRALGAAALLAEPLGHGASWRERAFTAVFEEGRLDVRADEAARLAGELGLALSPAAVREAAGALELATERARDEQVTGVPTFMLGWPFGGIQSDDTMLRVLERFARRARESSEEPDGLAKRPRPAGA